MAEGIFFDVRSVANSLVILAGRVVIATGPTVASNTIDNVAASVATNQLTLTLSKPYSAIRSVNAQFGAPTFFGRCLSTQTFTDPTSVVLSKFLPTSGAADNYVDLDHVSVIMAVKNSSSYP